MSSCNPEARRSIKPEEKKEEEEEAWRAASTVLKGRCKDWAVKKLELGRESSLGLLFNF